MSITLVITLSVVAFGTSFIAGVIGMGGGIILLTVLSFLLPAKDIVPIHSFIQVVSNLSRVTLFFRFIAWKLVWRFLLLAPLGVFLGGQVWQWAAPEVLQLLIGLFIVLSVVSKRLIQHMRVPQNGFIIIGFFTAFLSTLVGALGPMIAPLFLHFGLKKEELIVTKASCQMGVHVIKTLFFLTVFQFDFSLYSELLIPMSIMALAGTAVAKMVLKRMPEKLFLQLFRYTLILMGSIMVVKSLLTILS